MKIAIISHLKHPIREPFAGGLEMHTHLLTRHLAARGHDVTLFAAAGSDAALPVEIIGEQTCLISNTDNEPWYDKIFFHEHHIYLSLMAALRNRDFDVIHNNSLHYLPVVMAETLRTPMLTTLHTPPFSLLESALRIAAPHSSLFVAVSQFMRALWSPIRPIAHVIPNGVDLRHFTFREHPETPHYLFWFGRIVPEKGLHLAIAAARQAAMPLQIAGPINDQAYFDEQIAPRLGDGVAYLSHFNQADLMPLIAGASACLFTPRWDEPYGLVVAEALACGTPVAAFARGALGEIVNADCGILVPPDDVAALAAAARAAPHLNRAACRARALDICDAARMITAYETLYETMRAR